MLFLSFKAGVTSWGSTRQLQGEGEENRAGATHLYSTALGSTVCVVTSFASSAKRGSNVELSC